MRRIVFGILPLLVLIAVAPAAAQDISDVEWINCRERPAGRTYDRTLGVVCGTIRVPEDWDQPDGAKIDIGFAILEAMSPSLEPVLYMSGGPGEALTDAPQLFDALFSLQRMDHDLIIFDQRGTGISNALDCAVNADQVPTIEESGDYLAAVGDCYKRLLTRGFDVPEYNTINNARDAGALMQSLAQDRGYTGFHVFGASYGTRLALVTLREAESTDLIRSVTLDSVFPPQIRFYEQIPGNFQEVMWNVFDRCAADPICAQEYPNLADRYVTLLQSADDPFRRMTGGQSAVVTSLTSDIIYYLDLSPQFAAYIPRLIDETERNGENGARAVLSTFFSSPEYLQPHDLQVEDVSTSFTVTLNWTIQCREEAALESLDGALQTVEGLASPLLGQQGLSTVRDMFDICANWRSGVTEDAFKLPVASDIPVLILLGSYDLRTPPSWGRAAAETLTRATVLQFDASGHFVVGWNACARQVFGEFITDPHSPLDTSCLGGLGTKFVMPDVPLESEDSFHNF